MNSNLPVNRPTYKSDAQKYYERMMETQNWKHIPWDELGPVTKKYWENRYEMSKNY